MAGLRLNLGCGDTTPTDWTNCDVSWNAQLARWPLLRAAVARLMGIRAAHWPRNVQFMALGKPFPWADGSARYVYASHVAEHLSDRDTDNFFREAERVLQPGGVIRIVVPDLHYHATTYVESVSDTDSGADHFLYVLNMRLSETSGRLLRAYHALMGHPHMHKTMYDRVTLRRLLTKYGFVNVITASYGTSAYMAEIHEVEFRVAGYEGSLYMEAKKP